MFDYVMGMNPSTGTEDHDADTPPTAVLLAGTPSCPADVRGLVTAFGTVTGTPLGAGGLAEGAVLTDRLTVLARLHTALDAEIGRTLLAAEAADV
ncbi:MAG: hypothetical protein U0R64_07945 [Candidatus Nanopelagicales bacterium]